MIKGRGRSNAARSPRLARPFPPPGKLSLSQAFSGVLRSLGGLYLALPQTISPRQFGETRPQRFVKSRQIPLKKSTFGDLGSSIDLVNPSEAELVYAHSSVDGVARAGAFTICVSMYIHLYICMYIIYIYMFIYI